MRNCKELIVLLCVISMSYLSAELKQEALWDAEADKQVIAVANSSTYVNEEVVYSYAGQKWDLRVIRCPHYEKLISDFLTLTTPFCLLTKGPVPRELFSHLEMLSEKVSTQS